MRSANRWTFSEDMKVVACAKIVDTIRREIIATSVNRNIIDHTENIGMKLMFVSRVIAIIITALAIVQKKLDNASVALNSKHQTAIHARKDISDIQVNF
jgi:hypothetical protein